MLEQQVFVERLRQYLIKRRFEEQSRIDVQTLEPTLELRLEPDWKGWVYVSALLNMNGCSSIELKQYTYQGNDSNLRIVLPFWKIKDVDCRRQYLENGLASLKYLDIKTTADDAYMNSIPTLWRMSNSMCNHTTKEMTSECVE